MSRGVSMASIESLTVSREVLQTEPMKSAASRRMSRECLFDEKEATVGQPPMSCRRLSI